MGGSLGASSPFTGTGRGESALPGPDLINGNYLPWTTLLLQHPDTKALFMTVWRPSTRSAENSCGIRQG